MEKIIVRTLSDLERGIFSNFDPSFFCSVAADGSPFYSLHGVWFSSGSRLWIGSIFRDFPDEGWQIHLRGAQELRGVWSGFSVALDQLLVWQKEQVECDRQWRLKQGLLA